ncbi:hypothetical protein [Mesotoga sp.]|uniref:hypothetical protein n=1 Tax=Mesotoga sp. TaxID=2053577 RepID=UPI00345EDE69
MRTFFITIVYFFRILTVDIYRVIKRVFIRCSSVLAAVTQVYTPAVSERIPVCTFLLC